MASQQQNITHYHFSIIHILLKVWWRCSKIAMRFHNVGKQTVVLVSSRWWVIRKTTKQCKTLHLYDHCLTITVDQCQ